jgi:hypothetical protein
MLTGVLAFPPSSSDLADPADFILQPRFPLSSDLQLSALHIAVLWYIFKQECVL